MIVAFINLTAVCRGKQDAAKVQILLKEFPSLRLVVTCEIGNYLHAGVPMPMFEQLIFDITDLYANDKVLGAIDPTKIKRDPTKSISNEAVFADCGKRITAYAREHDVEKWLAIDPNGPWLHVDAPAPVSSVTPMQGLDDTGLVRITRAIQGLMGEEK